MTHRPVVTLLIFMIAMILAMPAGAQQKPFTQDQVQGMVRDGLGDETGAKAIEQRIIDFAPTEDVLQSLKAAGANEALLKALRAAKHPQPKAGAMICWGIIADWLVAIGTLVLAVMAVFQETIRGWFYCPALRVSIKTEPPDCVAVPFTRPADGAFIANSVHLRLWVENSGNATAKNAEV